MGLLHKREGVGSSKPLPSAAWPSAVGRILPLGLSRTIDVTVSSTTSASPERTFDVIVPIDLSSIFEPWFFIPGVDGARDQTGPWDVEGETRTVLRALNQVETVRTDATLKITGTPQRHPEAPSDAAGLS